MNLRTSITIAALGCIALLTPAADGQSDALSTAASLTSLGDGWSMAEVDLTGGTGIDARRQRITVFIQMRRERAAQAGPGTQPLSTAPPDPYYYAFVDGALIAEGAVSVADDLTGPGEISIPIETHVNLPGSTTIDVIDIEFRLAVQYRMR